MKTNDVALQAYAPSAASPDANKRFLRFDARARKTRYGKFCNFEPGRAGARRCRAAKALSENVFGVEKRIGPHNRTRVGHLPQ